MQYRVIEAQAAQRYSIYYESLIVAAAMLWSQNKRALSGHFRLDVVERRYVITQVVRHIAVSVDSQQISATAAIYVSQKQQAT